MNGESFPFRTLLAQKTRILTLKPSRSRRSNENTSQSSRRSINPPTTAPNQSRDAMPSIPSRDPSNVYVPPHRNGDGFRYSNEHLLDVYNRALEAGSMQNGLSGLFIGGWQPGQENGSGSNTGSAWGRSPEQQRENPPTVDTCWDRDGAMQPLSLSALTTEESELYSSVNSTIKPTQSSTNKDGNQRETLSRKLSNPPQHGNPNSYGLSSPTSRPGPRRRDTSESYPFPPVQTSGGNITNPPPSLLRRRTDYQKDSPNQEDMNKPPTSPVPDSAPFSALKRTTTGGGAPAWASSSNSAFSPIAGAFGNFAITSPINDKRPAGGTIRGESRFKGLMKDTEDDSQEKQLNSLAQENWREPRSNPSTAEHQDENLDTAFHRNLPPQQTPLRREDRGETLSPTNTNPYQSPEGDNLLNTGFHQTLPGLGGFNRDQDQLISAFGAPPSASNPPSALLGPDPFRGMGMLPGLGTSSSSTWAANSVPATARSNQPPFSSPFGDGLFSPADNAPSPFGNTAPFAQPPGGFGRGGRFGTQFMANDMMDLGNNAPYPAFGENESPVQQNRIFDHNQGPPIGLDTTSSSPFNMPDASSILTPVGPPNFGRGGERPGSNGSNAQPPSQQQRQMVMPDRMKWEYKDHNGVTQGPFSGLEMHDWYKAGYFTPELQIKKIEDKNFEPLAHLIRRIGNSREPFLVPQIGVPHEPQNQHGGAAWAGPAPPAPGGIQPPFPNSFPSFGTTLTAEQQNDLERRKQEAQYLMARQKEFLNQHHPTFGTKMPAMPPPFSPQQLNHQQSNPSLHSQPSFGNMASAFGQTSQPPATAQQPGNNNNTFRPPSGPGGPHPGQMDLNQMSSMMDRMNLGQNTSHGQPAPLGPIGGSEQQHHAQQINNMLGDRANLQFEAAEADTMMTSAQHNAAAQLAAQRLQEFNNLRDEPESDDTTPVSPEHLNHGYRGHHHSNSHYDQEPSITQQVQAAVSAKAQPHKWERVDMHNLEPIVPPPPSMSPMPAPVAQRKQNVADKFSNVSSPSPIHTPVETPTSSSIAPWAKESHELPKLSLKEIQEAEAKKAARQEEIASVARRAALEREVLASQQATALQPAPGLPSSANWASSPTSTAPAASVWGAKIAPRAVQTPSTTKKTLQQIQKEEEARKQRAVTAAATAPATNGQPAPGLLSSGKRYADLASKISTAIPAGPSGPGGAWTTVGAGGKSKTPIGASPALTRAVSGSVATIQAIQPRPKQTMRSTTLGAPIVPIVAPKAPGQGSVVEAVEEVRRWAVRELGAYLKQGISGKH
jgi:PERQ amino acid-rich with GYF domain-containing protein